MGRLVDLMGKIGRPGDVPKLVELARAVNRPETPVTNAGGLIPGYAMALNRLAGGLRLDPVAPAVLNYTDPATGKPLYRGKRMEIIADSAFEVWLKAARKLADPTKRTGR